jgi:hypothetical protein
LTSDIWEGKLTEGSLDDGNLGSGRVETGESTPIVNNKSSTDDFRTSVDGSGDKGDL